LAAPKKHVSPVGSIQAEEHKTEKMINKITLHGSFHFIFYLDIHNGNLYLEIFISV
jgi:hypothetical protein